MKPETIDDIQKLNRKKMLELYKERFSYFNYFHFVIVGDATTNKVEKFIGTYLANLPVGKKEEMYISKPYKYRKGANSITRAFNHEQSTKVILEYRATVPYSVRNKIILNALANIMQIRLRNSIREEKAGVYAVGMSTTMDPELKDRALLSINFNSAPKRADELIKATRQSIEKVKNDGITQKELSSFQENFYVMLRSALKENSYWLDMMMNHYKYHTPLNLAYNIKKIAKSITPKDVRQMAQNIFSGDSMTAKLIPKN